ncbi:glycosyl hydrolase [Geofilum rubicundum]|uniref:Predicted alpha-L-rhamnosidase n=1 Tax=Geofilum rubicundum JCM 15548 TaxID=1236989 RepID=A0A0E9LX79_9BACT|nr:glycosyl hydrolase [Geofilum rubicundum]GAO29460.1 predicted alpha-L-rhamnosidase [Geofilum rubicundum JCM 15548]
MQKYLPVAALLACSLLVSGCDESKMEQEVVVWPTIEKEMKPWTRWWWMGSAVNERDLQWHLKHFEQQGFGGVEIAPIYGAKGFEDEYISYLSPKWMEMLDYLIEQSDSLGLGVDMTNGTGWPFGGPHITPDVAAGRLFIQSYEIAAGSSEAPLMIIDDERQKALGVDVIAITGYGPEGEVLDLLAHLDVDKRFNWKPESGVWDVKAAFHGRTRQQVKRAAPGGEGFTFDHFSPKALEQYLSRFDEVFGDENPGVRSFFNDSYELFGASWGENFFEEFEQRRGYSLKPHLDILAGEGDEEVTARIKSDYRETMSELLIQNFSTGWTQWANSKGAKSRNQSHGSPANLLDVYATVDIPEIETFGGTHFPIKGFFWDEGYVKEADHNELFLKMAASAANISGKKLVSCETFTWLGEHFRVPLSQAKPEAEQVFLSGVNHIFYHGTTYSSQDAPWPGWLFYASVHFAPSNSFWPHISGLNEYITRCQSILQGGTAANDLLVYWPIYDTWHKAEGMDMMMSVHGSKEWLASEQVKSLLARGYSFDFVSDALLATLQVDNGQLVTEDGQNSYQAVVIPECERMPLETLQLLVSLAEAGVPVVFQSLPTDVPGYFEVEERRNAMNTLLSDFVPDAEGGDVQLQKRGETRLVVAPELEKGVNHVGVERETLTDLGLKYIRRYSPQGIYYYVVNHTADDLDAKVVLNQQSESIVLLDPQTGASGLIPGTPKGTGTELRLQIRSGESRFVLFTNKKVSNVSRWSYRMSDDGVILVDGQWTVDFVEGGIELPEQQRLNEVKPWTELNDSLANRFSGTAHYSTTFEVEKVTSDSYLLDLGEVMHSARVVLNGTDLGLVWSPPFVLEVGDYLQEGQNELTVEVANLMANRIRDMDRKGIEWQLFHEINFVDINYRGFDAAEWPVMPSGLKGPVRLIPQVILPYELEGSTLNTPLVFDFGSSAGKEAGRYKVAPGFNYTPERGYGFDLNSRVATIGQSDGNAVVASETASSFYFSVRVPEGNYKVTVVAGHPDKASELTIKAESRRWMTGVENIPAGETRTFSFVVNRRSARISDTDSIHRKPREYAYMNWDEKLTLEFNGKNPAIHSVKVESAGADVKTVFLAGNSTVVDQENEPYASWGQMITRYFNDEVVVANFAESGESLASTKASGRWRKILSELKKGDFVMIEFGHNDQKRKGEGIGPYTSFTDLMTGFVNDVKERGGVPIVLTPIQRRRFDEAGQQVETHGDYPDAVRKVAKKEQVHLIDLTAMSTRLFEAWGPEASKNAFVHYPAGTFPRQNSDLSDNTHFNNYGAYHIALCVIKGLQGSATRLDRNLSKDVPVIDLDKPLPYSQWRFPYSLMADAEKPDGN